VQAIWDLCALQFWTVSSVCVSLRFAFLSWYHAVIFPGTCAVPQNLFWLLRRGPRKTEPNFAAGKFSILKHYQAAYTLVTDVYLLVIQHRDDNPFHSDYILGKAKRFVGSFLKTIYITHLGLIQ
jgi:hypothetical protein